MIDSVLLVARSRKSIEYQVYRVRAGREWAERPFLLSFIGDSILVERVPSASDSRNRPKVLHLSGVGYRFT